MQHMELARLMFDFTSTASDIAGVIRNMGSYVTITRDGIDIILCHCLYRCGRDASGG